MQGERHYTGLGATIDDQRQLVELAKRAGMSWSRQDLEYSREERLARAQADLGNGTLVNERLLEKSRSLANVGGCLGTTTLLNRTAVCLLASGEELDASDIASRMELGVEESDFALRMLHRGWRPSMRRGLSRKPFVMRRPEEVAPWLIDISRTARRPLYRPTPDLVRIAEEAPHTSLLGQLLAAEEVIGNL